MRKGVVVMIKKLLFVIFAFTVAVGLFNTTPVMAEGPEGLNVRITVKESAGVDAHRFPVTAVVPLPYGEYQNTNSFRLVNASGSTVKAQFDVLNRHYSKDHSIRHVTVHFFTNVSANGSEDFFLKDDGPDIIPGNLVLHDGADIITVDTGTIRFTVDKSNFSLIDSLQYKEDSIWHDIVLPDEFNGGILKDRFGNDQIESQMAAPNVSIEEDGPVRAVIRLELPAKFRPAGQYKDLIPGIDSMTDSGDPEDWVQLKEGDYEHTHGYCVRIYAYEGQSFIRVDFTLENSDKTVLHAWPLYLKEFSLGFKLPEIMNEVRIGTCNDRDGKFMTNQSGAYHLDTSDDVYDVYEQTGGPGVYISQYRHNDYKLIKEDNTFTEEGDRGTGWIDKSGGGRGLQIAVKDFWQTWPNALQADENSRLVAYMFSPWAKDGYLDWENGQKYTESSLDLYWVDDMQHITKTYWLNAHGQASNSELENLNKLFQKKPVAVIPTEWYKETAVTLDFQGLIPIESKSPDTLNKIYFPPGGDDITSSLYPFGYDNYMADVGRRNGATTGGWPHSSAWIIATENPIYYYISEARIFGDLNARPQHLAGYDYETDLIQGFTPLDIDPYHARSMRYWKHSHGHPKTFAPYLWGSYWSGYNIRDFEHYWMYEFEEFYYLTADRRIYDFYKFQGEFLKGYVFGTENCPYEMHDDGATHATRAEGHVLNTILQAYRVTGDPSYLEAGKAFVSDLKKNQTKYGSHRSVIDMRLDTPFQSAYLARGVINFLDLVKGVDQKAYLEGFAFLQGLVEWNYHYGSYEYFLSTDLMVDRNGNVVDSDPTAFLLPDSVAWYYWYSGDERVFDHMKDYIDGKLEKDEFDAFGNPPAPPADITNWRGDHGGRWTQFVLENERAKKLAPDAITDLQVSSLGDGRVKLTWTGKADADWYWVNWSERPIVSDHTPCDGYCNWWAGTPVTNTLTGPGSKELTIEGLPEDTALYFAVKSVDENHTISPISNVVRHDMGTGDTTPPSAISDLTVIQKTEDSATLEWTIPGDDGAEGTAVETIMKLSTSPINEENFDLAPSLENVPLPNRRTLVSETRVNIYGTIEFIKGDLSKQSFTIEGLEKYQPYYVAMKAVDDVGNISDISNVIYFELKDADKTPPADITDLEVLANDVKGVRLRWTAPGNDGMSGQAEAYDIRFSKEAINDANWGAATRVDYPPTPKFPGDEETYTVKMLDSDTIYYFAMKTRDDADNWSGLSNVVSVATEEIDGIPPAKIDSLAAGNITDVSVELKWNATGDDGMDGLATAYELAYATAAFGEGDWSKYKKDLELPEPLTPGTQQTVTITGLTRSTKYYFAIRALDNAENYSPISNILEVTTEDAPSIAVGKPVSTNESI